MPALSCHLTSADMRQGQCGASTELYTLWSPLSPWESQQSSPSSACPGWGRVGVSQAWQVELHPGELLPQGTAHSFIPSNIPVSMTLAVQNVYKSKHTAKFSEEQPRLSVAASLTEDRQMKE